MVGMFNRYVEKILISDGEKFNSRPNGLSALKTTSEE